MSNKRQGCIERAWLEAVSEGVFPSLREMGRRCGLSDKSPATVSLHLGRMIEDGTMVPLYGGDQVHATVPAWVQEEARKRLEEPGR